MIIIILLSLYNLIAGNFQLIKFITTDQTQGKHNARCTVRSVIGENPAICTLN